MVGLAAIQFDIDGAVLLTRADARSRLTDRSRRVSRTATLDGSAVLTDLGYTHADRTLVIVEPEISATVYDAVAYLLENYQSIVISCRDGVFEAALESQRYQEGQLSLRALVIRKLSA